MSGDRLAGRTTLGLSGAAERLLPLAMAAMLEAESSRLTLPLRTRRSSHMGMDMDLAALPFSVLPRGLAEGTGTVRTWFVDTRWLADPAFTFAFSTRTVALLLVLVPVSSMLVRGCASLSVPSLNSA